jgi:TrmH family RNA methyltransferase
MITSRDNAQLKQIHKLQSKKGRASSGLFVAEGEDLVTTAEQSGWTPEIHLRADEDVEPELLDRVSSLGSGTRVIGVYRQRWSEPRGDVCVYLHGVSDPGNVGTIIRAAHALCDGPVILGAGCADPFGPKAVRASMGSIFARPPAKASLSGLPGLKLGLDSGADATLLDATQDAKPPIVLCVGAEREGFPDEVVACLDGIARIPQRLDGPDSLNVAMAASIGLYELANRMAHHA